MLKGREREKLSGRERKRDRGMKGDERRLKQVESKEKKKEGKIVIRKEASPSQDPFKSLSPFAFLSLLY